MQGSTQGRAIWRVSPLHTILFMILKLPSAKYSFCLLFDVLKIQSSWGKKNTKKSKHSASLVISALRKQPLFSTNRAYCWVLRLPRWRTAHSGSCSHQTPSWKWKAGRRFCSLDAHSGWTEGGGKHRTKVFRIYNTCLNKQYIWKKLIQSSLVLHKKMHILDKHFLRISSI